MQFSQKICYACFLIFLLLLSSCSSTHQAYLRTLKLAFDEVPDINFRTSDIQKSPVDLIYVKKGEQPIIVLALAFIENGQYKWISSDKATLIEKNGRIIKTLFLDHNLDVTTAETADPLAQPFTFDNSVKWNRQIDFDSCHFGIQLESVFSQKDSQILTIQENNIETILIEEHVKVRASRHQNFDESEWLNQFWINEKTGKLIRSKQKMLPDGDYFDITYVSRALRL